MIEPSSSSPQVARRWMRPAWFVAGIIAGLAALGFAGHRAAQIDYHPDFVRFDPPITPEGNYYATADELCNLVRGKCRPDQILVIVGGNSILLGVWQPVSDLWSVHLQEALGDQFCVVNLAFRGSMPADGGALIAEMLRKEYPRQIYIADEAPVTAEDPIGSETYRFLFWQAYLDDRLLPWPPRAQRAREYLTAFPNWNVAIDTLVREEPDRALHFHEFWNWLGFDHLFTVSTLYAPSPPELFKARRTFPDQEPDAGDPEWRALRYPASSQAQELSIVLAGPDFNYRRGADGAWELRSDVRATMARSLADAFPDALKARVLMLIPRSSPHYRAMTTADDRVREDKAFEDTVALWKRAGYDAMQFGRDYNDDDYGDRSHLSKFGGRKLAASVAPEIKALAARLGYLR